MKTAKAKRGGKREGAGRKPSKSGATTPAPWRIYTADVDRMRAAFEEENKNPAEFFRAYLDRRNARKAK